MQSFAAPPSLYPEELHLDWLYAFARLDFGDLPSVSLTLREQLYWSLGVSSMICAQWNGISLFLVGCLNGFCGLKVEYLAKFGSMLNTVVSLLSNSAYLIVLPQLLSVFDCVHLGGGLPPLLRRSLSERTVAAIQGGRVRELPSDAMVCWEGEHTWIALVAMLEVVDYVLSTTMASPFFLEDYTGERRWG